MQTLKMDPERAFLLRDGLELDLMKLPLVHTNLIFPGYTVSYLLISLKMPWTAFPSWVTSARQLGGFIYINYIVSLRTQHPLPLFASATSPSHTGLRDIPWLTPSSTQSVTFSVSPFGDVFLLGISLALLPYSGLCSRVTSLLNFHSNFSGQTLQAAPYLPVW